MQFGFWWGRLEEENFLEGAGVDGRITIKWIFEKWVGRIRTGSIWLRI